MEIGGGVCSSMGSVLVEKAGVAPANANDSRDVCQFVMIVCYVCIMRGQYTIYLVRSCSWYDDMKRMMMYEINVFDLTIKYNLWKEK